MDKIVLIPFTVCFIFGLSFLLAGYRCNDTSESKTVCQSIGMIAILAGYIGAVCLGMSR